MNVAVPRTKTSWAALSRPPIAPASAGAGKSFRRADACRMGGRVKPGQDEIANDFNNIKYSLQIVFPLQNLYLYWSYDLWYAHTSDLARHRGGTLARAENAAGWRGSRKSAKSDEQFCCRSFGGSEPRQPHRRRCAARQQQCASPWSALGSPSRKARRAAQLARQRARAPRQDAGAGKGAERGARRCHTSSSWPGSTRPPIALASASAKESFRRVDTRRMGGRIKSAPDENVWDHSP